MAFTVSAIFQQAMLNPIAGRCWTTAVPTTFSSLSADTINCALFGGSGNTIVPDKTAAVASTGFNTGVWTTGAEVTGGANWPSGGIALSAGKAFTIDTGSSSICFQATQISAASVTIANAYGCFIYDNTIATGITVAKQGLCFNYFGGLQQVTSGTFTVVWATVGALTNTVVFNITV